MREEWHSSELGLGVGGGPRSRASSWSLDRLLGAAVIITIATFVIGFGLGRLFSGSDAGAVVELPAVEVAGQDELPSEPPATEIGDAAAVERRGRLLPAATQQLLVAQVSTTACGTRDVGTGVLVDDGLMLTAAHLVGDAGLVRIDHGGITVTGEVRGVVADGRDVAVIELDAPLEAPVASADMPGVGAGLTLVGFPETGVRTVVVGPRVDIAPAVAAGAGIGPIAGVDAPIRQGMSGGPAVDETGAVVGLTVAREVATDTALVVSLPPLDRIDSWTLTEGTCPQTA